MTLKQKIGSLIYKWLPLNRRTINVIRYEVACQMQMVINYLTPSFWRRIGKLRKSTGLFINLGSGGKGKSGWVNVDMHAHKADDSLALDVRRALPFSSKSAMFILAEHVFEHLDPVEDVPRFLSECHRILAESGVLRIVVPDCERYCRAYSEGTRSAFLELGWDLANLPTDIQTRMQILNHQFHQGGEHLFGWDFETISLALRCSGFESINKSEFGESAIPAGAIDQPNHRLYSLYVDAIR